MVGQATLPQAANLTSAQPIGVMEQLKKRKAELQSILAEIDSTIELFEKMPEMEQCLTSLSRIGIYR